MAFSDRPKGKRAEKLSLLKLRSEKRFVLSIFRAAAFLHKQDPLPTSGQVAPERLPDAVVKPELDYFEWRELR